VGHDSPRKASMASQRRALRARGLVSNRQCVEQTACRADDRGEQTVARYAARFVGGEPDGMPERMARWRLSSVQLG
jgi:hypothetical protein